MTKEKMRAMRKACNRVSCQGCGMFKECMVDEMVKFCKDNNLSMYPMFWTDEQIEKYGE